MECLTGSNIDLYITDQHILYYYMHACSSLMMECSYFQTPDYLIVQGWRAMLLYSNHVQPTGL